MMAGESELEPIETAYFRGIFSLKVLLVLIFFGAVPSIVLLYKLIEAGLMDEALAAWQGEFFMFGLPTNPWLEILPAFSFSVLLSILIAGFGILLIQHPAQTPKWRKLKPVFPFILAFIAAIAFEFSLRQASIAYLSFVDHIVVGLATFPPGIPTLVALIFLFAVFRFSVKGE